MKIGPKLAAAMLLLGSPAFAAEPATAPTDASKSADADRPVCKTKQITGSRLGAKRICMTRREWAQRSAEDRKATEDYTARGSQIAPGF
jgi:hypothetical protein